MVDIAAVRAAYGAAHPAEHIRDVRLLGEGWDRIAYLVNETTVLRFPKTTTAARAQDVESRVLSLLRNRLAISIPEPTATGIHPKQRSWNYAEYRYIPGVELTPERFRALAACVRERVVADLADFLGELHSVNTAAARRCGVKPLDLPAQVADVFARFEALVSPTLEPPVSATIHRRFQAILKGSHGFTAARALVHGDLASEHVLFDETTERVSGVIDFGDVAIADPDYDFMALLDDYGEPFYRAVVQRYEHADPVGLREKLRAFRVFDAARGTLFGYDRDEPEMIRDGLWELLRLCTSFD